ncbi:MAG: hypothetical protein WD273_07375 [Trueperaceae bacterium]
MKPALRRLLICALLLVVGFGAQAQGDEILERYGLALVNLSESMRMLSTDITASRDELDRAAGALRFLATRAGESTLVEAMERVFERARTAILNRSSTDLAVQSSLLRGGFQRAVYNSALGAFESEPAVARARLERLAEDLDFPDDARVALSEAPDLAEVRRIFEGAVAVGVSTQLGAVQEGFAESRDGAYRALADAYADFLLVQDSPRANSELNASFGRAAQGLVENRGEEMTAALAMLSENIQSLAQAAQVLPNEADSESNEETIESPAGQIQAPVDGDSVALPLMEQTEGPTAAPEEATGEPAEAAVDLADEAGDETSSAMGNGETVLETTETTGETVPETTAETAAVAPPSDTAVSSLEVELIAAGVPSTRAAALATQMAGSGVTSLDEAINDLFALAARIVAAAQSGYPGEAREATANFTAAYGSSLQSVIALLSPAVDDRITSLVDHLMVVPATRTQDALVLLGQVDALAGLLSSEAASAVQVANAETTLVWAGWVRLITLIVLSLLAIVPLYLLNLAFGGGNRNWQLIGVALFLLLLPIIFEGVASLGALVAEFSGVEELGVLVGFSMFHNPIAQVLWAAITAAGIMFAVAGLYGICVQFGLIGARRLTSSDSQSIRSTAVVPDADTVVDWDEEF